MVLVTSSCPPALARSTWRPEALNNVQRLVGCEQQGQLLQAACDGDSNSLLIQAWPTDGLSTDQKNELQQIINALCNASHSSNLVQAFGANTEVLKTPAADASGSRTGAGSNTSTAQATAAVSCSPKQQQQQTSSNNNMDTTNKSTAWLKNSNSSNSSSMASSTNFQQQPQQPSPPRTTTTTTTEQLYFMTEMPGKPLLQHLATPAASACPATAATAAVAAAAAVAPSPTSQQQGNAMPSAAIAAAGAVMKQLTERQVVSTVLRQLLEAHSYLASQGVHLPCLLPMQLWMSDTSRSSSKSSNNSKSSHPTAASSATAVKTNSNNSSSKLVRSKPSVKVVEDLQPPAATPAKASTLLLLLPLLCPIVQPLAAAAAVSCPQELQYLAPELLLDLVQQQQQATSVLSAAAQPSKRAVTAATGATAATAAATEESGQLGAAGVDCSGPGSAESCYCAADNRKGLSWSLGVLTYQLLTGHLPFKGTTAAQLGLAMSHLKPGKTAQQLKLPLWMSDDAKDFIAAAMQKDPAARPSPSSLMNHPWVAALAFQPAPPTERFADLAAAAAAATPVTREEVAALQDMQGANLGSPKVNTAAEAAMLGGEERWRPRVMEIAAVAEQQPPAAAAGGAGAAGAAAGTGAMTAPKGTEESVQVLPSVQLQPCLAKSRSMLRASRRLPAGTCITDAAATAGDATSALSAAAAAAAVKPDEQQVLRDRLAAVVTTLSAEIKQSTTPASAMGGKGSYGGKGGGLLSKKIAGGAAAERWSTAIKSSTTFTDMSPTKLEKLPPAPPLEVILNTATNEPSKGQMNRSTSTKPVARP